MKKLCIPLCVVTVSTLLSSRVVQAQCGLSTTNTAGTNGNNNGIGTLAWSGTDNTTAQDGSYASVAPFLPTLGTLTTNYLTLNNFGFNVPASYTVCGVGLSIGRDYSTTLSLEGYATDNIVQLATINSATSLTLLGSNQAVTGAGGAWNSGSIATAGYGGNGNTMGATLTPADVNSSAFGVAISADLVSLISLVIHANIDKVSMSLYVNTNIILPVKLDNFTVIGEAAGNTLRWTAPAPQGPGATQNGAPLQNGAAPQNGGATQNGAAPRPTQEFVVQRSPDGTSWEDLATLDALAAVESYSYTDVDPLPGPNYYRLELLNQDGIAGYSITAVVASKNPTGTVPPGIHFYPNPFHDIIGISASRAFSQVRLSDVAGRTLKVEEYPAGTSSMQVSAADLPRGLYFVTVDGTTYKLIKN